MDGFDDDDDDDDEDEDEGNDEDDDPLILFVEPIEVDEFALLFFVKAAIEVTALFPLC